MTYAVTAAQMREAERAAIQNYKIPALILMENAAVRTAGHIDSPCMIFCGTGNNGGDGFALARQLYAKGVEVTVVVTGKPVTEEASLNLEIIKSMGVKIFDLKSFGSAALIKNTDVIVDALFGTGLTRPVTGFYADLIALINTHAKRVVSLDIPSGLNADTGQPMGAVIKADETVTYGFAKTGLLLYPGALYAGKVNVEGISLPFYAPPETGEAPYVKIIDDTDLPALMPVRKPDSNKGSHGRVCAVAGSASMPGAASLACVAAYKTGAGLVDACVPSEVAGVIHNLLPEAVTSPRAELEQSIAKASALIVGPGLGADNAARDTVLRALKSAARSENCAVVLDADGLNAVSAMGTALLKELNVPCVITPHPGEMSRLTGLPVGEILSDPLGTARKFSAGHKVHVLLKGARTVTASPDGNAYINTSGCSALAKAGTGDVLAGVVAGLLAQGKELPEAAALGAFIHGKAGEKAAAKLGEYAVCARDVAGAL